VQTNLLKGLELAHRVVKASDLLRLQSVLQLLMSGRPMRATHENANLHRSIEHPHFKSNRWNERSCWRDAAQLEN
jgi:hypothetical protein